MDQDKIKAGTLKTPIMGRILPGHLTWTVVGRSITPEMAEAISRLNVDTELLGLVAKMVRTCAYSAVNFSTNAAVYIHLSNGFFSEDPDKRRAIASSPFCPKASDTLVEVDFNIEKENLLLDHVRKLVIKEVEPFIIGVGEIKTTETTDGFTLIDLHAKDRIRI